MRERSCDFAVFAVENLHSLDRPVPPLSKCWLRCPSTNRALYKWKPVCADELLEISAGRRFGALKGLYNLLWDVQREQLATRCRLSCRISWRKGCVPSVS